MIDKTLDTSWDTALSKFVACLYLESVRVTNKVGERGGILLGHGKYPNPGYSYFCSTCCFESFKCLRNTLNTLHLKVLWKGAS